MNSAFLSVPPRKTNRQRGSEAEKREREAEKTKESKTSRQTDNTERQGSGKREKKQRPYSSVYLHFLLLNHELAVLLCAPSLTRR